MQIPGFAGFGDSLIMTTIHKIESEYRGKLKFTHSIVNEKPEPRLQKVKH